MDINIIAHEGSVVNINIDTLNKKVASSVRKERLKEEKKKPSKQNWTEHKREALKVGDRMIAAGLVKRGYAIKMCGNELIIKECRDCGQLIVEKAYLCRDRLCPICNWRLALKRYGTMQSIIEALRQLDRDHEGYTYALMTFTVKNCKAGQIKETLGKMQTAWNRMLAQRFLRPYIVGWARSIEVTFNKLTNELHPHYHVLMIVDGKDTLNELQLEWLKQAKKEGFEVSSKAQRYDYIRGDRTEGDTMAKSICETFKYMVKSSDTVEMPLGVLREFAKGIAGKRLVSFGGIIKKIARMLDAENLDTLGKEEEIKLCTKCKGKELDTMIAQWSMRGNHYLAISGVDLHYDIWE